MAANDHLNDDQFYHGSRHPFKPGDKLSPEMGARHANYGETDSDYVYGTKDVGRAYKFAQDASAFSAQARGEAMGLGSKPETYAPKVFKVQSLGGHEPDEDWGEGDSWRTPRGFQVLERKW
jgi:hypothetical protein